MPKNKKPKEYLDTKGNPIPEEIAERLRALSKRIHESMNRLNQDIKAHRKAQKGLDK